MIKRVLYFGNHYVKEDSLAIIVANEIRDDFSDIKFIYIKDTFQLMDLDFEDSLLLDVADNIEKVEVVDAKKIKTRNVSTTHDFDLGFYLNLSGKDANIIVIPMNYDIEKAREEVKKIISNFHSNQQLGNE